MIKIILLLLTINILANEPLEATIKGLLYKEKIANTNGTVTYRGISRISNGLEVPISLTSNLGFIKSQGFQIVSRITGSSACPNEILVLIHDDDGIYEELIKANGLFYRFKKKFKAGQKYIPLLFEEMDIPEHIEQIAVFVFASKINKKEINGAKIMLVSELLQEIIAELSKKHISKQAVSEQYPLLRTIQYITSFKNNLFN